MKAKVIEAVKAAMESQGVTKAELAKRIGCTYQHVHDLLAGRRRWNEDYIERVCYALDIKINFEQGESNHVYPETD